MKEQSGHNAKTTGMIKSTPVQGEQGKSIKDELSEQELDKASGGISVSYGSLEIKYKPQKSD
ncbi:MAG: hypothetical protein WAV78_10875 [Xanthobacteraceae bacterium]|jgi:hypothetical protein